MVTKVTFQNICPRKTILLYCPNACFSDQTSTLGNMLQLRVFIIHNHSKPMSSNIWQINIMKNFLYAYLAFDFIVLILLQINIYVLYAIRHTMKAIIKTLIFFSFKQHFHSKMHYLSLSNKKISSTIRDKESNPLSVVDMFWNRKFHWHKSTSIEIVITLLNT